MQKTQKGLLLRVRSLSQEEPLEKGMAIHSSTLAWEIPWIERPGWLQSMGPQNSWTQLSNSAPMYKYMNMLKNKSLHCTKNLLFIPPPLPVVPLPHIKKC